VVVALFSPCFQHSLSQYEIPGGNYNDLVCSCASPYCASEVLQHAGAVAVHVSGLTWKQEMPTCRSASCVSRVNFKVNSAQPQLSRLPSTSSQCIRGWLPFFWWLLKPNKPWPGAQAGRLQLVQSPAQPLPTCFTRKRCGNVACSLPCRN
jgi:hypothetical protein